MSNSLRKRRIRRRAAWASLALAASALCPPALADVTPWGVESLLQIDINRQKLDENVLVIREPDGGLLIAREDLQRWRVRLPEQAVVQVDGKDYFRLQSIAGAVYSVDETSQRLTIELPAVSFQNYRFDQQSRFAPAPAAASPGGFFLGRWQQFSGCRPALKPRRQTDPLRPRARSETPPARRAGRCAAPTSRR